jgi:hypothetical protein
LSAKAAPGSGAGEYQDKGGLLLLPPLPPSPLNDKDSAER